MDGSAGAVRLPEVTGRRVTVMGLGRHGGGVGAARFLTALGARVTVTDVAMAADLMDSLAALADVPIERYALGGHCERDFRAADLVVVNPAVRAGDRIVEIAREAGAVVTTEIELFLNACPATVVGVTGSNGKSTTAAMTTAVIKAAGRRCWLGGNIGGSLLSEVGGMRIDDVVVLELSSFQLARLSDEARGVDVAVVTNCAPNHLDWHGGWPAYVAAKQRLLKGQTAAGVAVLNDGDAEVAGWRSCVRGTCLLPLKDEAVPALQVPGAHNRQNAACAGAAARAVGCSEEAIREGLAGFGGLPHRLQCVREIEGRTFYNDSLATTPESACVALGALGRPVWMLVGGYDKGCEVQGLVERLASEARGVALFGATGEMMQARLQEAGGELEMVRFEALPEAVAWCWERSSGGDAIVMSPGFASFDQYRDFGERGEHFMRLVAELEAAR